MKTHLYYGLLNLTILGLATGKTIPNHAIANLVLGQTDFVTSNNPSSNSSFKLNTPGAVCVDPVSGKVFVADRNNHRVLRYPSASSLTNGAGAEAVFGKNRFSDPISSGGDQGMNSPRSVSIDRFGRLWVSDNGNNRVLMFEAAVYRSTAPFADRVFGQPDFATVTAGTTAAKMDNPLGAIVDSTDTLWVADDSNNRVLRFDSVSTKNNGANADGVLGQTLFTTSTSSGSASGMSSPCHPSVSSTGTLYVADSGNDRILRFPNAASLANGSAASGVLGQIDFASTTGGLSSTKFDFPTGTWLTPDDSLWVTDVDNSRVLRFSKVSTLPSGSAADGVVGQPNFDTETSGVTNRSLGSGFFSSSFVDGGGNLWVADPDNDRVLRFPPDVTKPLLAVTPAVPKKVTKKKITIKGTASDAFGISKVQYMVGNGPLKTATGTTSWSFKTSLASGKNKITIFATDSVGNKSLNKVVKVKRVAKSSPASILVSGK